MPTRGRQAYASEAVRLFEAQTYPHLELVIIDDRDNPSFPHGISGERIHYHAMQKRVKIDAKRNVACSRAQGELICHWDDDDVSVPARITEQVSLLLSSGADMVGFNSMVFIDEEKGEAWRYHNDRSDYAIGTSLLYRRSVWERMPFRLGEGKNDGEDTDFVNTNRRLLKAVDANNLMLARTHSRNTSPRKYGEPNWKRCEWPEWYPMKRAA